jgi:hypothetical protein
LGLSLLIIEMADCRFGGYIDIIEKGPTISGEKYKRLGLPLRDDNEKGVRRDERERTTATARGGTADTNRPRGTSATAAEDERRRREREPRSARGNGRRHRR